MDKKVEISMLCDIYGKLLTPKQFSYLNDYYNHDLSLSEIAENDGITRQAARDNIKKGEHKLLEYEEKLGLMHKNIDTEKKIENMIEQISKINTKSSNTEIQNLLENIKRQLEEIT